jgi:Na+/H+-dicarboxylate symporter
MKPFPTGQLVSLVISVIVAIVVISIPARNETMGLGRTGLIVGMCLVALTSLASLIAWGMKKADLAKPGKKPSSSETTTNDAAACSTQRETRIQETPAAQNPTETETKGDK